jgi:DNA topoisomerase-1
VRIGRYGPLAQIGENEDADKRFANLRKGQSIDTINLEEALDLFKLPRKLIEFEGKEMVIGIGKFGPYIRHNNAFYSIAKGIDPLMIDADQAVEIILAKRLADANKIIKTFTEDSEIKVLNGRFGPYIARGKENFKIPKDTVAADLSYAECLTIIEKAKDSDNGSKAKKRVFKARK